MSEQQIADELAKTLERARAYFEDDEQFNAVIAIYKENPLLKLLLDRALKEPP